MKKLFIIAIIGWMSVFAVQAQIVAFHGGYAFDVNHGLHPNRTAFAVNYMENHGVFGIGVEFPSGYDPRFGVNLHGGLGFYWNNFMLSPQVEIGYTQDPKLSLGAGLLAEYKIVGPLGIWTKVRWMSPVRFDPLNVGSGGTTTFAIGLTMYWFR